MEKFFDEKDFDGFTFAPEVCTRGLKDWDDPEEFVANGDDGSTVAPMLLL